MKEKEWTAPKTCVAHVESEVEYGQENIKKQNLKDKKKKKASNMATK